MAQVLNRKDEPAQVRENLGAERYEHTHERVGSPDWSRQRLLFASRYTPFVNIG